MTEFTFLLPRRMVLSSNDRKHFQVAAAVIHDLRALARLTAVTERVKPMRTPVRITITFGWPDRRRRDAPNLWPTVKPLIDGITDEGVLPDDNDTHVHATTFQASPELAPKGHVRIHIELQEVAR